MYEKPEDLPGELFDAQGNRIFIKGYLLSARQEAATAVSRTIAMQTVNRAMKRAEELAGSEFVDDWLRLVYKVRIEGKEK